MKRKLFRIWSVALLGAVIAHPTFAGGSDLELEFEAEENDKWGWGVVNDGVMGGLSKGNLSFEEEGVMRFSGNLSLENNGGFSSVRSTDVELDLGGREGLEMRVMGDGRTYQVRISTDARYWGMEVSFMAEFPTKAGKWTEVKVPFGDFVGSFRGKELPDEVLNPSKVERLGFLLADKKAGDFELKVDWVRTYGKASGQKESKGAGNVVERALADGRFKTLATALTKAELVEVLQGEGKFTVFAPTDEAFAKLPKGTVEGLLKPENKEKLQAILKYHVVSGELALGDALKSEGLETVQGGTVKVSFSKGKVRVNEASLVDGDVACANGVIHVIDAVLIPSDPAPKTVLSVAKEAGTFKTLVAAVEAAGLTTVLEGEGPFTVLAPTDEAFAKLPKGTVESLLKKENLEKLKGILAYHVISGSVSAGDALNAKSAKTLNGQEVTFAIADGMFKANGATVRAADIAVSNGVVHVIDAVLMPSEKDGGETEKSQAGEAGSGKGSKGALARIEMAIDKGVPLYNGGSVEECADVYAQCIAGLVENEGLDGNLRKMLAAVLEKSEGMESADDRAWLFRRSLDGTVVYLTHKQH